MRDATPMLLGILFFWAVVAAQIMPTTGQFLNTIGIR